jgi:hypothetical protein
MIFTVLQNNFKTEMDVRIVNTILREHKIYYGVSEKIHRMA